MNKLQLILLKCAIKLIAPNATVVVNARITPEGVRFREGQQPFLMMGNTVEGFTEA